VNLGVAGMDRDVAYCRDLGTGCALRAHERSASTLTNTRLGINNRFASAFRCVTHRSGIEAAALLPER
jgi:hypothetical protein